MDIRAKSIRPFIGAKNFQESSSFYRDIGFEEVVLSHNLTLFRIGDFGFYLQDAYVKDWVDNTMVFMEVEDVHQFWDDLQKLNLPSHYHTARITPVRTEPWGAVCYVHDPSGILWHFGTFSK